MKKSKWFAGGYWKIAIKRKNLLENNKFVVINTDFSGWIADPFIYENNNKLYVFVEKFNLLKEKGEIYCLVYDNEKILIKRIISNIYHMSYPCIYYNNNTFYIIPETSEKEELICYKSVNFPFEWQYSHKIAEGVFIDSTFFSFDENSFFYSYRKNKNQYLLNFYKINSDLTNPYLLKSIIFENDTCRPAGMPIIKENYLLIPFQYGINKYGEKIVFNKFTKSFDLIEENTGYLDSSILGINDYKITRVHTFNSTENYEIIDFFVEKFDLFVIPRMLYRRIRKFCINYFKKNIK